MRAKGTANLCALAVVSGARPLAAIQLEGLPIEVREIIGRFASVHKRVIKIPHGHLGIDIAGTICASPFPQLHWTSRDNSITFHFFEDQWVDLLTLSKALPNICYLHVHQLPWGNCFKPLAPTVQLRLRFSDTGCSVSITPVTPVGPGVVAHAGPGDMAGMRAVGPTQFLTYGTGGRRAPMQLVKSL